MVHGRYRGFKERPSDGLRPVTIVTEGNALYNMKCTIMAGSSAIDMIAGSSTMDIICVPPHH